MIASAIKVNVATAMPSENVTKLELYPSEIGRAHV